MSFLEAETVLSPVGASKIPWADIGTLKDVYEVSVRIKSSKVKTFLPNSASFGDNVPSIAMEESVLNNSKLHINVGISFARVQSKHSMLSALSSLSLSAFRMSYTATAGHHNVFSEKENISYYDAYSALAEPDTFPFQDSARAYLPRLDNPNLSKNSAENLYDLYITNSDVKKGLDMNERSDSGVQRHLGLCDFSLCNVLETVSTRLMLQILMLILCEKPVILLSSSSALLTKMIRTIPRLVWPFRIDNSHTLISILNEWSLNLFCGGTGSGDQKMGGNSLPRQPLNYYPKLEPFDPRMRTTSIDTHVTSSSTSSRSEDPFASAEKSSLNFSASEDVEPFQRLPLGRSYTSAHSGMMEKPRLPTGLLGRSISVHSVAGYKKTSIRSLLSMDFSSPTKSTTSQRLAVKCNVCSIVLMDSNTFFAMSNETRGILLSLTAFKDSIPTVIDLDACLVQVASRECYYRNLIQFAIL